MDAPRVKVAFVGGASIPYDEAMSGFGGTQLCVLHIAGVLAKHHEVYVVHSKRREEFTGRSGIKYVKDIDCSSFGVIVDVREVRHTFLKNVNYIHWIHDRHATNPHKTNPDLGRYDSVIALTRIQASMWGTTVPTHNFLVINNPLIMEPVGRAAPQPGKIVALSARANFGKCLAILKRLRRVDRRFVLHVCAPSYDDISGRAGGDGSVINHGALSHLKTMELLSDAFVCLFPTESQENGPCICYECMHYGVPMLTEYVAGSGANEILPKHLVLPRGSHADVYAKIILGWHKRGTRPAIRWNHRNHEIYQQWENLVGSRR